MMMMLKETQALWDSCVHPVRLPQGKPWPEMRRWLSKNIPRDPSGWWPYKVEGEYILFQNTAHAVLFSLKWL